MASYILDTNVVAALMRGEGETEDRLLREKPNDVYLVQPVIAEVEYGLARLPRSRRRSELAKRFSTEDSSRFVNGVLSAIAKKVRAG